MGTEDATDRKMTEEEIAYFYDLAGLQAHNPPREKPFKPLRSWWRSTKQAIRRKASFSTSNQKKPDTDSHLQDNDGASNAKTTGVNTDKQSSDDSLRRDVTLQSCDLSRPGSVSYGGSSSPHSSARSTTSQERLLPG